MNTKKKILNSMILPTLRAKMGDWIYYISYMKMDEIAKRIKFAEDIHENKSLNDLLQRRLTERSKEIVQYLEHQKQRFFNTIIIGVYGGSPKWFELTVSKNRLFDPNVLPDTLAGAIGYLYLSGKERLFAIDGQHRVAGIQKAVENNDYLRDEEVSVIFVSAKRDEDSIKRTRRLFSTLNRYAKTVSKKDIIALDEDDVVAIITRQLLDEYKLFSDYRINTRVKGKSIPKNDNTSITTVVALYDALNIYLCDRSEKKWKEFQTIRPSDKIIAKYFRKAVKYWGQLQDNFKVLRYLLKKQLDMIDLRHQNGGHLLFRPVGLLIITKAVKLATDNGFSLKNAVSAIAEVPMELSNEPWAGLLWEKIKKRMITRKENQDVAENLLYYMINGDLRKINTNEDDLKSVYASAINWDEDQYSELSLPLKVKLRTPRKHKKKKRRK